jgi:hypothetical protein
MALSSNSCLHIISEIPIAQDCEIEEEEEEGTPSASDPQCATTSDPQPMPISGGT